jgi:hypothetical protein
MGNTSRSHGSVCRKQDKISDKPGDKGRDEGDQASNIHKCIDGYSFHGSILMSLQK